MISTHCGLCTSKQTKHDGNPSFQVWLLKTKKMSDLICGCLWRGWKRQRALSFLLLIQHDSWKTWTVALCDPFPSLLCKRKTGRPEEIKKAREIKWCLKLSRLKKNSKPATHLEISKSPFTWTLPGSQTSHFAVGQDIIHLFSFRESTYGLKYGLKYFL